MPSKEGHSQSGVSAIRRIEEHISRMPSLPVTVTRVLDICNRSSTSAYDLNRVISLDPVLTGQVLKLINSAYYGLRNRVTSLPRAIIMLGMNTIKNLVISTAVLNILDDRSSVRAFSMEKFWCHCLCSGVAAKWLAAVKGVAVEDQEEYFVGGLLHDLGKIPLNNLFPSEYGEILTTESVGGNDLCRREQEAFGVDHAEIGGIIARKWKLGDVLENCMRYHHETYRSGEQALSTVRIVALADMSAKRSGVFCEGDSPYDGDALDSLSSLCGFSQIDMDDLDETLSEELEKARIFLQLTSAEEAE
ncbi:MAG: HDOD domain-containing protein [Syntrophales bacterium]|nr:HDOD domain-containing protein [Syntrophales bacterium]